MGASKSGSLRAKISPLATPPQTTRLDDRSDDGLIALRYESLTSAKAPIPITVAPPRAPPLDIHPALRRQLTDDGRDESKRDSGLAPTTSTAAREGSVNTIEDNALGFTVNFDSKDVASTKEHREQSPPETTEKVTKSGSSGSGSRWRKARLVKNSPPRTPTSPDKSSMTDGEFSRLTTPIPTESLMDEDFLDGISFSKRGSIMLGGKKGITGGKIQERANHGRRQPSFSMIAAPSTKLMSDDLVKESQKVRSMYEQGADFNWLDGNMATIESRVREDGNGPTGHANSNGLLAPEIETPHQSETPLAKTRQSLVKSQHEMAGGIEDWEDVNGADVDRYGFITIPRNPSRSGSPEPRSPQRVSTVLQQASDAPRKRRTLGRTPSVAPSSRANGYKKPPSRKVSARSLNTQASTTSQHSTSRASFRAATNRLPGNQDRRWMDEAGDMLTLPPGLADIAEDEDNGKAATLLKAKEWERTEKWRKMAKVIRQGNNGEGMEFEFDTKNSKLIERAWKGIPDRWRAAAWSSFLASSAKRDKSAASEEEIIASFHKLLDQDSADDVQIDIDVPRTINSHIMFRRRYRGGQRLLFRVLHSLSLYFPETGYVQGMASLAATLLCYFDEERCFVMLVRMWLYRGLGRLYENGFEGLMSALEEFRTGWLEHGGGGDVAKRLTDLSIEPTAYGTRWYLTLFNYSIPFAAQLRVWDVFMLAPHPSTSPFTIASLSSHPNKPTKSSPNTSPIGTPILLSPTSVPNTKDSQPALDILHATSSALIDGTREILLDSDFENAMKVLTSWIPVKDEELLMRVARAEWRGHFKKR